MPNQLFRIEIDLPQIPCGIARRLIQEVRTVRTAARAAGGDGQCAYLRSELDHSDEAVAAYNYSIIKEKK